MITASHPDQIRLMAALVMAYGIESEYDVRVCEKENDPPAIIRIGVIKKKERQWIQFAFPRDLFDADLQAVSEHLLTRVPEIFASSFPAR